MEVRRTAVNNVLNLRTGDYTSEYILTFFLFRFTNCRLLVLVTILSVKLDVIKHHEKLMKSNILSHQ